MQSISSLDLEGIKKLVILEKKSFKILLLILKVAEKIVYFLVHVLAKHGRLQTKQSNFFWCKDAKKFNNPVAKFHRFLLARLTINIKFNGTRKDFIVFLAITFQLLKIVFYCVDQTHRRLKKRVKFDILFGGKFKIAFILPESIHRD